MLIVGIDENGFGPQLGPLVVTASMVYAEDIDSLRQSSLKESKKICASGKMEICEMIALSFYELLNEDVPSSADEFLSSILIPQKDECLSPLSPCSPDFPIPCWVKAEEIDSGIGYNYLEEGYINLLEIKSIALCPGRFNSRLDVFTSKHSLEYSLYEELISYFLEEYPRDRILFLCGRIGSTKDYSPFFKRFQLSSLGEKEGGETRYRLPGRGEVRFITDGDEKYFPITLSSIIGKYIRELYVEQMNRFFRSHLPHLPYCSGYRNDKTKQFIEGTKELRAKLGIPDECFLRRK